MGEPVITAAKTPAKNPENRAPQRKTEVSQVADSPAEQILFLQRTIGNRAVERLIRSGALQAKLRIGQPGDKYEQEADRVAEQVMRIPETAVQAKRVCPFANGSSCKEKKDILQKKELGGDAAQSSPVVESQINSFRGGGQPLPESVSAFFEPTFGTDFSQVRVHSGPAAEQSARDVNAKAYTVGHDIVFGAGLFAPGTQEGRRLIAHELTHVIQQNEGYISPRNSRPQVQLKEKTETPAEKISRIIADKDDDAIVALKDDELSVSSASQRAGMIRILTDLTWTSESEERATLRFLKFRGEQEKVIRDLDSLGYRQKVIDSIDNNELNKELLGLLSGVQEKKRGDDAIAKALASNKSDDVIAIRDFSHATNEQRLGLLQIMLGMSSSDEAEEGKILDILESAGMGGNLKSLMDKMKTFGLKQSLFDHIDAEANKKRLTTLLTVLNDPELNKDLEVFNRGFFGNVWEGIKGGISSAYEEFSLGKIIMGILNPIIHPIDTIIGLIDQFLKFLQKPSWDRFLAFARDLTGTIALWLGLLGLTATGIAALAAAGVVTIPASIPIAAIAAALNSAALYLGIGFLIFTGLKFLLDLTQAGSSTTTRELEREQKEIGEDITLTAVILLFAGILKGIKLAVARFKGSAVDPKLSEKDVLDETAKKTESSSDQAKDATKEMKDKANEAKKQEDPSIEKIGSQPASRVIAALGEKAMKVIKETFGDLTRFDELVRNIQNIKKPTMEIVRSIRDYFDRMGYSDAPENKVMLKRLEGIARGEIAPERADIDFMQHELLERALVEKGISKGYQDVPGERQVWDPAHDITRTALGVDHVYHPDALKAGEEPRVEIKPPETETPERAPLKGAPGVIEVDKPDRIKATDPEYREDPMKPGQYEYYWELYEERSGAKFCEVTVAVDKAKAPIGSPDLDLDVKKAKIPDGNTVELKAKGFSWTVESLRKAISEFTRLFGSEPEAMSGSILKDNLANFQYEFSKIRSANPGLSVEVIARLAIREISFGKHRIQLGYGDFKVEVSDFADVKLEYGGKKGESLNNVPQKVNITAKKGSGG